MAVDDNMKIDERYKYLRKMQVRYFAAQDNKAEQGSLLDEMAQITGLHRKSLIRLMGSSLERQPRRKQRPRSYGPMVVECVRKIAASFDHIGGDRMHPKLVERAQTLARHGELEISPPLLDQLGRMSRATLHRMLQQVHQDEPQLPRLASRPTNLIARAIPAGRIAWDLTEPGHFEVDLVHHCGPSSSGDYMHTLQMIDVATGWSERVPVLGRSYLVMRDACCRILERLPFPILELHPDNGSEFLNAHLVRFWQEYIAQLHLSRSRPFNKNDNRYVEQGNSSLVRRQVGFERLDSVAQVLTTNAFYEQRWLFDNFFQPVTRQTEKLYCQTADGQMRVQRRHDVAQTPLERLCASGVLHPEVMCELLALRERTNPCQLLRESQATRTKLLSLPGVQNGEPEDVALTLAYPVDYRPIARARKEG